jgi:phospholipid-binding lipoprotein MlaA
LEDFWIAVNQLLQGKLQNGVGDGARLLVNTTIGILGLFDVASEFGLDKHNEDFGQTLATWGVGSGPYVVLPLFGATTLRDGLSRFTVDWLADPVVNINHVPTRNTLYAERVVSNRADVIGLGNVVEEAALDKYSFSRDAYLQRRESLIHDGNPPRSPRAEADVDEPSRSPTVMRVVTGTYPTPALLSELSANMAPTVVTDGEGRPVSIGSSDAPLLTRSVGGL